MTLMNEYTDLAGRCWRISRYVPLFQNKTYPLQLVSPGPPIQGALLTEKFVWWRPSVFSGTFGLLGTALFGLMAYLLHRRHQEKGSNV